MRAVNLVRDENGNVIELPFPGMSRYTRIKVWRCIHAVKMDVTNKVYVRGWVWSPCIPLICLGIIIFFFVMSSIFLFPTFGTDGYAMIGVTALLAILFIVSFLMCIFVGPGYLPFYWAKQHSASPLDIPEHSDDSPSGIISTEEQLAWAKSQDRPPRCIISSSTGRVIMRPDHVCMFTQGWIGKKNHKLFLLFNLYNTLFCAVNLAYAIRYVVTLLKGDGFRFNVTFCYCILVAIASLMFGGFSLTFLSHSCFQVMKGITTHEASLRIDPATFSRGCPANVADVCGPCKCCPIYVLPVYPWGNKTNEELLEGYVSYYTLNPSA